MSRSRLLTTTELAQRLGLHRGSLARWRVQGKGPNYFKKGEGKNATVLYRLPDVRKWEKKHNFVKHTK